MIAMLRGKRLKVAVERKIVKIERSKKNVTIVYETVGKETWYVILSKDEFKRVSK